MVRSILVPSIEYAETKELINEDKNYEADLYEISLFGKIIVIALGQPNIDYLDREIIYYPVYIIKDDSFDAQIGVYEIMQSNKHDIYDDEGDIDLIKLGKILLYAHTTLTDIKQPLDKPVSDELEQAMLEKKSYKKTRDEDWIQTFMHNNNYSIIENEGGGDCLFSSIRDGLKKTGIVTTVADLRDILASEATESIFEGYLNMYTMTLDEIATTKAQVSTYEKEHAELAKIAKKSTKDRAALGSLIEKANAVLELHTISKHEMSKAILIMDEYKFMKGVNTLEEFRTKLRTSEFWGETWSISTIERVMNIKLILLGSESYKSGDVSNVLLCGQLNDEFLQDAGSFSPSHYIIVEYSGFHYRLVTYKGRGAITFNEIPYDIKIMVVDRCMEGASGAFLIIPDFKQFLKSMDLPKIEEDLNKKFDEDVSSLYDSKTVFQFYQQSANGPSPGKGSGEKIHPPDILKYSSLSIIHDWRRKLSNFWIEPFALDGHKWSSVEHFYQASKFKQNNPKFYSEFTLDANPDSELSKDPSLAKDAGSKSGKHKGKNVRPSGVKIDPSFFGGRDKEALKRSLMAKFAKKDFKELLLATRDARLQKFERASMPIVLVELMEVRKELMR